MGKLVERLAQRLNLHLSASSGSFRRGMLLDWHFQLGPQVRPERWASIYIGRIQFPAAPPAICRESPLKQRALCRLGTAKIRGASDDFICRPLMPGEETGGD